VIREPRSIRLRQSSCVGDFAGFDRAELVGGERNDRQGLAFEGDKFNLVTFIAVEQHDRADVAGAEAVLGQVDRQDGAGEFFHHLRLP